MLEVRDLKKSFGDRQILDGVNLTVKDGEILCIVGPSGAGKTTLLRCITGLETPDSGEFFINGRRFDPQGTDAADRVIGVVFQDFKLFTNLSVMENITLAPMMVLKKDKQEAIADAQKLLEELGLNTKGKLYPYQLSGGQKQRVAIARALAMKPKILCYDEPTSALDPELVGEVQETILNAAKNKQTMVLVSHEMDFVYNVATKVLFLEKGKIIEEGSPKEVFHHPKNPRTSEFLSRHVKTNGIGRSND